MKMTKEEVLQDLAMELTEINTEREMNRISYIEANELEWRKNGKNLKARRHEHKYSLRHVAELLGTSASRISRLERGEPVMMSGGLIKSYHLLFDHIELRESFINLYNHHEINWRL